MSESKECHIERAIDNIIEDGKENYFEQVKGTFIGKVLELSSENHGYTRYMYVYDVQNTAQEFDECTLVGIEVVHSEGVKDYVKTDFCYPITPKTLPKFAKKKDFERIINVWYNCALSELIDTKKFISKTSKIKWNK